MNPLLIALAFVGAPAPPGDPDDSCTIVVPYIQYSDATFAEEPKAESVILAVTCGVRVPGSEAGSTRLEQQPKWIVLDAETSQILLDAAEDLLEAKGGAARS
jgi:hypothetical protein